MDLKLKDKVAIVTGASKGIGAGIAKELAAEGVIVVVNYATAKDDADKVVNEIISKNGKAFAIQANVSVAADVKRLFEETSNRFGRIDIVVNNAGVYKFNPIEAITEEMYRELFDINVWGPILTTQEALKYFPESGGNIVNISSGASANPQQNGSLYAATKAAVDTLTLAFARELAKRKIRVNALAVGPTLTEGVKSMGVVGTDIEKFMIDATPLGRLGLPQDIASVVAFLVSDAGGWITGDRIKTSGGL
jgi:3-oxoacyl-[acyl-carrier protein] reductase